MNAIASSHPARDAVRAEPHKLLMGACIVGASIFWGFALWLGYF